MNDTDMRKIVKQAVDRRLSGLDENPFLAQRIIASEKGFQAVKKLKFRTVIIASLITLLLCTTAFALINQGLDWYYSNRFSAYQEHEPEKYNAIMKNLQTEVPQVLIKDPDINIAVTEASWVPEQNVMVVSIIATPTNPESTELHPMWNLDADGSYVGGDLELYADDEEARSEHWLWTSDGFGPVADMIAEGKQLLLLDANSVYLDDILLLGDNSSMDAYVNDEGAVHIVLETHLDFLDENYISKQTQILIEHPEYTYLNQSIEAARKLQEIIGSSNSLDLTIPYTVTAFTEEDEKLYNGGRTGEINFTLTLNHTNNAIQN